jgi:transposase-like protein
LGKVKAGESVMGLAKQYGVSDKTIYYWLRSKAVGSVSLFEHNRLKKENQQLKEIVGILTMELEKVKKKKQFR